MFKVKDRDGPVEIALDRRLGAVMLWLLGVGLLAYDSLDGHLGVETAWAFFVAVVASVWTVAQMLDHSRRVVLEVMSWEHRQLAQHDGNAPLRAASPIRSPMD